jgi:4-alpha-glucanotransferase
MHTHDCIVYTGTHDNDTTLGWYRSLQGETLQRVSFFARATSESMPEALVREALGSVGQLSVIPMQDVLGLGAEARLNTPGTITGNWSWKLPHDALQGERARHFAQLNRAYGRT